MNFPNGSRAYVDNQTTFILGEGSNLTIGKVENTAGIIGVEGNGKLKINEYKGKDLYNHDSLTTTGGSIGTSGAGISNENHRKEGITRHTVIGNVEIGSVTGSPINRDRSKANETTRDDHSSTNVYVESQTIDYALHPAKFKEDVGIAVLEGSATVEGALKKIDNILRGDDNSDISQSEKRRYEEIKENIIRFKTAPDMKLIAEGDLSDPDVQKRLGIGGRFNPDDPNLPEKIKERIAQVREQGQEINYFYDKVTGKIYINENADEDEIRAGIGREWGIRNEFDRGRTKPNGEGQEKGTVAGEIAYKEIEDRTKEKGDKKVNPYDFEYAKFDPNSEVTGDKKIVSVFNASAIWFDTKLKQEKVQQSFQETYGKKYSIDWEKYNSGRIVDMVYREKINYYYYQSLNSVKTIEEFKKGKFEAADEKESVFHNIKGGKIYIGDESNKKFIEYETGKEVVLNNKLTKIIKDPVNIGTFNYYTYVLKGGGISIDKGMHGIDVYNWIRFGTGINDKSTFGERIDIFVLGTIVSTNYKELKEWSKNRKIEYIGYKELIEYDEDLKFKIEKERNRIKNRINRISGGK
ncbi:hypothetical protein [Pseudoleptotrichia goodfellowii]|uniref:Hemolysin n=2 Tax=Pseudoleptotrichia goodfellowii F0264 TaxID=596323 RepID=D0GKE9_9FUSO|nr:hypothetical protein [Pseudoleptotrichia goodfellowii]EEY35430.1 hypothetical protein HMPREF0554_2256 [Pseudoleptotrichia goodfellowii F0264]